MPRFGRDGFGGGNVELTDKERQQLENIGSKVDRLREFLSDRPTPTVDAPGSEWLGYLDGMKRIVGNTSNDLGFVSTLMAKEYLCQRFEMQPFDAAEKPQGANGLDIDEWTVSGERVIGEIKTTTPHLGRRLSAAQLINFRKDFHNLEREPADHKFFFVTHPTTFEIARTLLRKQLPLVEAVELTEGSGSVERPRCDG
jgi:hypothetical protein